MLNRPRTIGFAIALMLAVSHPISPGKCTDATLNGEYPFWGKGSIRDATKRLESPYSGSWTAIGTFNADGHGNMKGIAARRNLTSGKPVANV